jgi:hypothetical protein
MNDSDLTGDDLLKRIDELTGDAVRDPGGGNGWRHVLYAARREIRRLDDAAVKHRLDAEYWRRECSDARAELGDVYRELRNMGAG